MVRVQERDLRVGVRRGGFLRSVVIVSRPGGNGLEYVARFRPSWLRGGYYLLYTHRERDVRTYRNLGLLLALIGDEFLYRGPITLHTHDDPKLTFSPYGDTTVQAKAIDDDTRMESDGTGVAGPERSPAVPLPSHLRPSWTEVEVATEMAR